MKYEIITDRFEIEKLAEDIFLSKDKVYANIDYVDLCAIKKHGTFKRAIICDIDIRNRNWVTEFINFILSIELPLEGLRACMVNFIGCGEECTLTQGELSEILQFFQSMKFNEKGLNGFIYILLSFRSKYSMPQRTLKIQLLSAYEKTEQDKQEDKKYEQLIEEYRESLFLPVDFPSLDMMSSNDEQYENK